MAFFDHNPFVYSFFSCGLELVFQHKMAIFDHYCAPQLLFGIQVYWFSSTKRAIFYNNPFVHRFIWPSSCITLFHKVGLICFIAFFGLSLVEVWESWKLLFFSKKIFRNKLAIMAHLHLSEKSFKARVSPYFCFI